ncbi:Cof-type HAD-IIB family hydrolase [Cohnella laeviribosi]|uniref:Cof-type HAD-IIB family hydrolase n=1 Tax=Cohnella laeviribosi TaxID=380174 RepID=UPI003D220700
MTEYKLVAMDLDDTLLRDDLSVSEATKAAMAKAIAQGVHLTIATGRMFASAKQVAEQVGINVPIITYQGSLIRNLLDSQVLYERFVPKETARLLYEYTREHGLYLQTYINDRLYAFNDGEKLVAYAKQSNIPYIVEPEFDRLPEGHHTKLMIIDAPERLQELAPILRPLVGEDVHVTTSKPNYLEFIHREGTKGHALRFLASHYGIPIEQTIAIGDAWNDREMIEAAGLGVAMANAVPALREIADYVTLSNNEDGVRHVLEKFVLKA